MLKSNPAAINATPHTNKAMLFFLLSVPFFIILPAKTPNITVTVKVILEIIHVYL